MEKEAFSLKDVVGFVTSLGKAGIDTAKDLYQHVDKTLWITAPALGVLATIGAVHSLNPKAVADNADKYVVNEALKASLAESIRKQEMLKRQRETAALYNDIRKHDRFV